MFDAIAARAVKSRYNLLFAGLLSMPSFLNASADSTTSPATAQARLKAAAYVPPAPGRVSRVFCKAVRCNNRIGFVSASARLSAGWREKLSTNISAHAHVPIDDAPHYDNIAALRGPHVQSRSRSLQSIKGTHYCHASKGAGQLAEQRHRRGRFRKCLDTSRWRRTPSTSSSCSTISTAVNWA
jgi:hypothetical protein